MRPLAKIPLARKLRNKSTPAERKLWLCLRNKQMYDTHFRRQHPIGPYVVDFCTIKKKLVIELDGSGHLDSKQFDSDRTTYLNQKGYRVFRFWNNQVMNDLNSVILVIMAALQEE